MRYLGWMVVGGLLAGLHAPAEELTGTEDSTEPNPISTITPGGGEDAWAFSVAAFTYIVPDSREYVQPTVTADHGWLHLEGRYNYEDLETGSVWIGYNLSVGEKVAFEFTPMLGGVFGNTVGVAPGYKASLGWWRLELYTEGEYLLDVDDASNSFFYTWSELTLAPVDWFRFGAVVQRTKLYETEFDIQRGVMAGFSFKRVDLSGYVFNPDDDPTYVFAVGVGF